MQSAEQMGCRVQNAECRVKGALVGAIHESPENERIFVYSKPTGRGAPWCSRKQTIIVCKNGRSKPLPYYIVTTKILHT